MYRSEKAGCSLIVNYCSSYTPGDSDYSVTYCPKSKLNDTCRPDCANGFFGNATPLVCESETSTSGVWSEYTGGCYKVAEYCSGEIPATPGYESAQCSGTSLGDVCCRTCAAGYSGIAAQVTCLADTFAVGSWYVFVWSNFTTLGVRHKDVTSYQSSVQFVQL